MRELTKRRNHLITNNLHLKLLRRISEPQERKRGEDGTVQETDLGVHVMEKCLIPVHQGFVRIMTSTLDNLNRYQSWHFISSYYFFTGTKIGNRFFLGGPKTPTISFFFRINCTIDDPRFFDVPRNLAIAEPNLNRQTIPHRNVGAYQGTQKDFSLWRKQCGSAFVFRRKAGFHCMCDDNSLR